MIKNNKIFLLSLKSLLVVYALIDLVWMFVIVFQFLDEGVNSELNLSSPAPILLNPCLLLIACAGLRMDKVWSHILAILISGWLIKRILNLWVEVTSYHGHSVFFLDNSG